MRSRGRTGRGTDRCVIEKECGWRVSCLACAMTRAGKPSWRASRALVLRGIRFSMVGAVSTLISYVVFISLAKVVHYQVANVASWGAGLGVGFILNRRITYGIRGAGGLPRHMALFAAGSVGQLAVSAIGYAVLIGGFHLNTTLAFAVNLLLTASYMFAYLESIAFRGRGKTGR